MQKLKSIDIIKYYKIFILIQPILNMLIYFNDSQILSFIRPLFLITLYILLLLNAKVSKKDKIISFIYLGIFSIYIIIHIMVIKKAFYLKSYGTLVDEIRYLIYYGYYLLLLFTSYMIFKSSNKKERKDIIKIFIYSIFITIFFYYLSIITGTSVKTYGDSFKLGYVGWSNSVHYIGHLVVLSLGIIISSMFEYNSFNKIIKYISLPLIVAASYYFIGTKTGTYGCLAIIVFAGFVYLIKVFRKKGNMSDNIFIILFAIVIFVALPYTYGYKNMNHQKDIGNFHRDYDKYSFVTDAINNKENEFDLNNSIFGERIDYVLLERLNQDATAFDNRDVQKMINGRLRSLSSTKEKLFGYGFQNMPLNLWVETDFHTIYYCFGIVGLTLLIILPIAYLIFCMIKNIKNVLKLNCDIWIMGFSVWLNIGIIYIVGYVMYFAQTSIYFVIPLTLLYVLLEENSNEKKVSIHD